MLGPLESEKISKKVAFLVETKLCSAAAAAVGWLGAAGVSRGIKIVSTTADEGTEPRL